MLASEPRTARRSGSFAWSQRQRNGRVLVRLAGELDMATWSDLDELLGAAVSDGARRVMIDLSAVDYIDAHSIGLIVAAWTAAEDRGLSLRIDGLRGSPKDLFIILGLEALMATPGVDDVWVDDVRRPDVGE